MNINPQRLSGNWDDGIALDIHTIESRVIGTDEYGEPQFENFRSDIGELLYQFKYRRDSSAAKEIIRAAADYLQPYRSSFDLIVPVPPSTPRLVQPVHVLANGIGEALALPVATCVTLSRPTTALKNVTDFQQRQELLKDLYEVDATATARKNVLLFDDLYRSGATMASVTSLLRQQGRASSVSVLAITRTRSKR